MNTETKVLINLGFDVQLGGEIKKIRKLPIAKSREWRLKAEALDKERLELISVQPAEGESKEFKDLHQALKSNAVVFGSNPRYVTELVIEFLEGQCNPPLTRDWIEQNVTDEEIAAAFQLILGTVLPLEMIMGGKETLKKVMTPEAKLERAIH